MNPYLPFGQGRFPWPTFVSPLTEHDRQAIAHLSATGAAQAAAKKAAGLAQAHDSDKRKRAAKTWGKPTLANMRWNSFTAKWEKGT